MKMNLHHVFAPRWGLAIIATLSVGVVPVRAQYIMVPAPPPVGPPPPAVLLDEATVAGPAAVLVAPPWVQTTFGLRTWISTGNSMISYAGFNGVPDVMSELHWRKLTNPMLEFSGDSLWGDHFIIRADLGVGTIGSGQLRDQDFNGGGHTGLASDTLHNAGSDNLYYFNLDFGWRIVTWHGFRNPDAFLSVDFLLGWQYWSEKYVARGGTDLFPGDRTFPPGDVIASRFAWDSFRLGLRSLWQINEQWSLKGRFYFIPYADFENNDIHYLRTDLLQDPSFLDRAHGALGFQGDLTAAWNITPNLGLELGYRFWDIRSDSGISFTRTPGGDFVSPLNHAATLRHGVLLGLHWRF
jgi:hypothetical protein